MQYTRVRRFTCARSVRRTYARERGRSMTGLLGPAVRVLRVAAAAAQPQGAFRAGRMGARRIHTARLLA